MIMSRRKAQAMYTPTDCIPISREPLSADRERLKLRISERERQIAQLAHENWLDRLELGSD